MLVKVEIAGKELLQNKMTLNALEVELRQSTGIRKQDTTDEAKYLDGHGKVYIPCEYIYGALNRAASSFKLRGKSAKNQVAGRVRILEDCIPLNYEREEIDIRPVVVQRARIPRVRPKFINWSAEFTFEIREGMTSEIVKQILEEAGISHGIGDFRPNKGGRFGTFTITKFETVKD